MTIKILPYDKGTPLGKLADVELHFTAGPLEGLKLIGFSIWERRTGAGRNVTFPGRQYSVNGERRSFALLRPILTAEGQDCIRDLILAAYAEHDPRRPRGCADAGGYLRSRLDPRRARREPGRGAAPQN